MSNNVKIAYLRRKISKLENQQEESKFYDDPPPVFEMISDQISYYKKLLEKYEKQ